jgi:hypothetical protein
VRYVALALACEGPTDARFLAEVLRRTVEELLLQGVEEAIDVGAVIPVYLDRTGRLGNQPASVIQRFARGEVFADVLFVHADGAGDPDRPRRTIVDSIAVGVAGPTPGMAVVGAIPVRETEAWMLADTAAVEAVLGLSPGSVTISQPPRRVHTIPDPKAELATIVRGAPSGRRRRRSANPLGVIYEPLGATVDLAALRETPSFQDVEAQIRVALQRKGFL